MRMILNLMLLSLGFAHLGQAEDGRCCLPECRTCSFEARGGGGGGHRCQGPIFYNCCSESAIAKVNLAAKN
ncbi:hypothetical protein KVR01_011755 [Diaporthe batatas]|uniref:uncharacterized protein n=1 Tax=Diaporthe batatas TaxID=748121 RepID=UPI001D047F34|nr:uncharacterized protein KVR01_011755 [Diaporthe batatas]KAG8158633.1 hypothetical protein KVR01_011755 [Diaporthe batatas]